MGLFCAGFFQPFLSGKDIFARWVIPPRQPCGHLSRGNVESPRQFSGPPPAGITEAFEIVHEPVKKRGFLRCVHNSLLLFLFRGHKINNQT